jgi:hypothetical protein
LTDVRRWPRERRSRRAAYVSTRSVAFRAQDGRDDYLLQRIISLLRAPSRERRSRFCESLVHGSGRDSVHDAGEPRGWARAEPHEKQTACALDLQVDGKHT